MSHWGSPSSHCARNSRLCTSDFGDLRFLALEQLVDLARMAVRELLDAILSPALVVFADLALSLQVLQMLVGVAPYVPNRDLAVLRDLADDLDELLAALFGQLRDRKPDHLAVVRRCQAELRFLNPALDRLQRARVEGLDREQPRLGDVDRRQLLERGRLPVVVDLDAIEQRRRGTPGADAVELDLGGLDRLVHAPGRVVDQIIDHVLSLCGVAMIVPTRSPESTRLMFRSVSPN